MEESDFDFWPADFKFPKEISSLGWKHGSGSAANEGGKVRDEV